MRALYQLKIIHEYAYCGYSNTYKFTHSKILFKFNHFMPPPPTLICVLAVEEADTIDGTKPAMCIYVCGLAHCKVVFYTIGSNAEVIVRSIIEAIS